MKKFKSGLIVGKFCPLTTGHLFLITEAAKQCEKIFIISYTSQQFEQCDAFTREIWLSKLKKVFDGVELNFHIAYDEHPHDEDPEDCHRDYCFQITRNVFNVEIDAVFTSENYGYGFARRMQQLTNQYRNINMTGYHEIQHIMVDLERKNIPCSGTEIRSTRNNNFIVFNDYKYKRVAILGGESSGKTTIVKALAQKMSQDYILEYGREFYEKRDGVLNLQDMEHIAKTQLEMEYNKNGIASEYLFCDTTPMTTYFYSLQMFNKASEYLRKSLIRSYHHIFLLGNSIKFDQDGTRQNEEFRNRGFAFYNRQLKTLNHPFTIITESSLNDRINVVVNKLKDLKNNPN